MCFLPQQSVVLRAPIGFFFVDSGFPCSVTGGPSFHMREKRGIHRAHAGADTRDKRVATDALDFLVPPCRAGTSSSTSIRYQCWATGVLGHRDSSHPAGVRAGIGTGPLRRAEKTGCATRAARSSCSALLAIHLSSPLVANAGPKSLGQVRASFSTTADTTIIVVNIVNIVNIIIVTLHPFLICPELSSAIVRW